MWVSNNGDGSHDPQTDGSGFYWPGGPNAVKSAIFEDGLVWGGKVGTEIRVGGSTYRHGLQAGKILPDGMPDDPSLSKYRVYKILNGWENLPPGPTRDEYELDYNEWPVEDGAPWIDVDGDSVYTPGIDKPEFVGDETLWYVANDLDTSRSTWTYGSLPFGIEIQTTIYAFDNTNYLDDVVFKKYKIINKSNSTIDDLYLCYWADDDLGNAADDYSGCDPYYHLGYTYNGDNNDEGGINTYGTPPPAVGHMFVQGPITPALPTDSAYFNNEWRKGFKNLPMSSFAFYINSSYTYQDPELGTPAGTIQFYNYMRGLIWDGSTYINPNTGQPTVFPLSGDPVSGIGWYEGPGWPGGPSPGDRRSVINSGSVTLAVGDTQEVVIAIFMAIGTNNRNSISKLKEKTQQIQDFYGAFVPNIVSVKDDLIDSPNDFQLFQNYPNP
ncbi:MAG: hypothetical protein Q8M94_00690, partial [Ignavibacteria bacterium]|nr:hypothetical protein [Ignavibacteria bacterium]